MRLLRNLLASIVYWAPLAGLAVFAFLVAFFTYEIWGKVR